MKVKINNQEIELRNTFKSFIIYEAMQNNKRFEPSSITDVIVYFFSVCLASSNNMDAFTFDQFIEWLDQHPESIQEFMEFLQKTNSDKFKGLGTTLAKKD